MRYVGVLVIVALFCAQGIDGMAPVNVHLTGNSSVVNDVAPTVDTSTPAVTTGMIVVVFMGIIGIVALAYVYRRRKGS